MKYKKLNIKNLTAEKLSMNDFLSSKYKNIDINTRIIELYNLCKGEEVFQTIYQSKKLNSPNWKSTLKAWIEEIEKDVKDDRTFTGNDYLHSNAILIGLSYSEATSGDNPPLYKYVHYLMEARENNKRESKQIFKEDCFQSIILGVLYSFKLEYLKIEYKNLVSVKANEFADVSDKKLNNQIEPIIWTGHNVLLGYLIQWLKDNGLISNKTGRDTAIRNHFISEKGVPIRNIKQALQKMRDINEGQLPGKYEKIDPLLKTLKDLL